jgi:hypothetical protein
MIFIVLKKQEIVKEYLSLPRQWVSSRLGKISSERAKAALSLL